MSQGVYSRGDGDRPRLTWQSEVTSSRRRRVAPNSVVFGQTVLLAAAFCHEPEAP
jgi:hypothetical protein